MRKTLFLSLCAVSLMAIVACNQAKNTEGDTSDVKKISRIYYLGGDDTVNGQLLYEMHWDGDTLRSLTYSLHDDDDIITPEQNTITKNPFKYTESYTYADGHLTRKDNDFFVITYTYSGDQLTRIDQHTHDGLHFYRIDYEYADSGVVNLAYYSASKEVIRSAEAVIYNRRDTLGNEIRPAMPADTSLHLSAHATLHTTEGNITAVHTEFIDDQGSISTEITYDDKVNPFYGMYIQSPSLDVSFASLPFGISDLCPIRNNPTQTKGIMTIAKDQTLPFDNAYNYDYEGNYPVTDHFNKYRIEYVK